MRPLLILALLLVVGCGTGIDTGGYDRSCNNDGDCAPVFQGDACAVCACPNAAVARSAQAKYEQDLEALRKRCGPRPAIACAACEPVVGVCVGGTCSERPQ